MCLLNKSSSSESVSHLTDSDDVSVLSTREEVLNEKERFLLANLQGIEAPVAEVRIQFMNYVSLSQNEVISIFG
jgi:hypothetical protein